MVQNTDFQVVVQKIPNGTLNFLNCFMTEDIKIHQDSFPSCIKN